MSDAVIGSAIAASASVLASSLAFINARLIRRQDMREQVGALTNSVGAISDKQSVMGSSIADIHSEVVEIGERMARIEGMLDVVLIGRQ
jgi:hypothetical protein